MLEEREVLNALSALAHPTRLRAQRALVQAGPGGQCAGELAAALGVPAPTLSFHLKELLHAGLASVERDGRRQIYRAEFGRMQALVDHLGANCCLGQPCELRGAPAPRVTGRHPATPPPDTKAS